MKNFMKTIGRIMMFFLMTAFLSSCAVTRGLAPSAKGSIACPVIPESVMRKGIYHSVAPGETLWRISQMYEVDVETIRKVNNIRDVKDIDIGTKIYIPGAAPRKNVITLYPPCTRWQYIVIHHSATDQGNSLRFNAAHLRKGWESVGYHFIIDNGTCGKDEGQIEMTPRWIKQKNGAHCKTNGMNEKGIGICLVGNFSKDKVSSLQMEALVYLVNLLKDFYKISSKNIIGHNHVPRSNTECPGVYFPWDEFRRRSKV